MTALAEESRIAEFVKRKGVIVRISKQEHDSSHITVAIPSSASDSAVDLASKSNVTLSRGAASLQSSSRSSAVSVSEHSDSCVEADRTVDKRSVQVKVNDLASKFRSVPYLNNMKID